MARLTVLLFVSFLFIACEDQCPQVEGQQKTEQSAQAACPVPTPDPETGPTPDPEVGEEIPVEASQFEANFTFTNFERNDEDKVQRAVEIIKQVIQTKEFRNRVYDFKHNGRRQFFDTTLTNEQVYQKLLDGAEELNGELDHEMDMDLELYTTWRDTVGYTYADTTRIWMNTKFFYVYTPAEVAGNLFHEWAHKLGFTHTVHQTPDRPYSVPYALGDLIEELGKKFE